jgi:predicted phage terminase large subunit-like protein
VRSSGAFAISSRRSVGRPSVGSSVPSLEDLAGLELADIDRPESIDPRDVDFMAAVPELSPHLTRPYWLAPLVDVVRRMFLAAAGLGPPVRATCSVPPQHCKTTTIQHGIATWLRYRPQDSLLYATYVDDLAREKSREIRDLAVLAGVELRDDSNSLGTWTTPQDGGLRSRALVGGAITGTPGLRGIFIDDPYKDRRSAESAAVRRDVWTSFQSNIFSRLHQTTSILVNHTRWIGSDLTGRIKKDLGPGWEHINIPAINERGEALWPEGQPLSLLAEKRATSGDYEWHSLYMGEPRSKDGRLFSGVQYFTDVPAHRRVAIGVDLAYTDDTSSDWSVAVVMAEASGRYYVLDVVRRQCTAPVFAEELRRLSRTYPGAPMRMFGNATERGSVDLIRQMGVPLAHEIALTDKFVRAQPLSAAWNGVRDGEKAIAPPRVYVPQQAPWLSDYLEVMHNATGLGGELDDDVDASSAAFSLLPQGAVVGSVVVPDHVLDARPRRDPAITVRGRGRLGTW